MVRARCCVFVVWADALGDAAMGSAAAICSRLVGSRRDCVFGAVVGRGERMTAACFGSEPRPKEATRSTFVQRCSMWLDPRRGSPRLVLGDVCLRLAQARLASDLHVPH